MKVFRTIMISLLLLSPVVFTATYSGASTDVTGMWRSKNPATSTTTMPPRPQIEGSMNIIPFPAVGETAVWVFKVNNKEMGEGDPWDLANSRAWLSAYHASIQGSYSEARLYKQIPLEEIVVDGDTVWEGSALGKNLIEIRCTIKLPSEGIWLLQGEFECKRWNIKKHDFIAAADGIGMQYYSDNLTSSSLAYLQYFRYGTTVTGAYPPPTEGRPVVLELNISKPPRMNEKVKLTWRVSSPILDVEAFTANTTFSKRGNDNHMKNRPLSDILLSIDHTSTIYVDHILTWTLDFKKGEPVEVSAIVRFPEPGEWEIHVQGNYPLRHNPGFTDDIRFIIAKDKSYYGSYINAWKVTTTQSPGNVNTSAPQKTGTGCGLSGLIGEK